MTPDKLTSILNIIEKLPKGDVMMSPAGSETNIRTNDLHLLRDHLIAVEEMVESNEICFQEIHHKTECGYKYLAEMMGKIRYTASACIEAYKALKEQR